MKMFSVGTLHSVTPACWCCCIIVCFLFVGCIALVVVVNKQS